MLKILLIFISAIYIYSETIDVYTYHNHAPFIVKDGSGKTEKLVDYLNKNSNGKYEFKLRVVPRSRLNHIIKPWVNDLCINNKNCKNNWMVLWVNHKWGFGKNSLNNFSWIPLLSDANVIVSGEKSINYKTPDSLKGKVLAGISGHKYVGIDDLVKAGEVKRINGNNERENLLKVLAGRVDVTLLPESSIEYYKNRESRFKDLIIEDVKHQTYMRNIMVPKTHGNLTQFLQNLDYKKVIR